MAAAPPPLLIDRLPLNFGVSWTHASQDMTNLAPRSTSDRLLVWYERQPWFRALVQAIPVAGGGADTLLAWRGSVLAQRRFEDLLEAISRRVSDLEQTGRIAGALEDEHFVELFKIVAEAAANTASDEKRRRAAALIAGTIRIGNVSDLTNQIARDLSQLDDFHLAILAKLPQVAGATIDPTTRPPDMDSVTDVVYQKAMADLERFGFIHFNTVANRMLFAGGGRWDTTEYLVLFMKAISDQDLSASS